jgi:molybdate transport system permease protein
MKRAQVTSISNKIVIGILALIVLTYFLFIILPLIGIFLQVDLSNMGNQLQSDQIIEPIRLSLYTSAVATIIAFVLTVPTAYFLATRKFRGKAVFDTFVDLPIVLPPAVAGLALLYAFAPRGLLGPALSFFGITIPGFTIAVVIAEAFVASPFLLRSAKTGFESMDKDILNSARILSGSRLRVFVTVSFPLSIRAITSGMVMSWARAMGEFGATLMFAGNLPGITSTMPLAIYSLFYSGNPANVSLSLVLATILTVISFSVIIVIKLIEQNRFGGKK